MCGLIMPILEENNTIDQLVRMMMIWINYKHGE